MCGRGRLFPDTEQPPQNAPHAAGRTPHHDLHALTSCHASTPRRRRSAETPPETSGTPPETRRRSGCPAPAPARRSPETSFRRHIVARYIPPLLQYMKERTRRAWRGGTSRTPSPTGGSTYRPVGRGPRAPPENAYPAAGHMGPALQVHTPLKKQRGAPCGAPRVFRPCVAQTEEGYIRRFYKREPRGRFHLKAERALTYLDTTNQSPSCVVVQPSPRTILPVFALTGSTVVTPGL